MELPRNAETWIVWLTYAPLAAASIVGLAITLFKFLQFRRTAQLPADMLDDLFRLIDQRDVKAAVAVARARPTNATRLVAALLSQASRSTALLKERANQVGGSITREMEYGLGGLALIATLGPLFGLFGTVVGITLVFNRLGAGDGMTGPQQLAAGISTALYTTIVGLIIGVFGLVWHRYFSTRLDRLVGELEGLALDVVERLSERH